MCYYILPKNNNKIKIEPIIKFDKIDIYVSFSLYNFYIESKNQLKCLIQTDESIITFKNLLKIVNPHEYIFSNVQGFKQPISKLHTKSTIFYDLLEIFNTIDILGAFFKKTLKSLHISENYSDSNYSVDYFREKQKNEHLNFEDINEEIYNAINDKRYDFIFYEIKNTNFENLNYYILNIIQVLMILLKYQSCNGVCLIKINHIFYKPIIDVIYILSSIYEKVYIIKPSTSNIITFDKYIVCKNFILDNNKKEIYKTNYFKLAQFINVYLQKSCDNIISILDNEIPSYFINKIDNINIITGQQQLESIDQITNNLKNKNKEEKNENIKKINIQKSIMWCEKFKIPHNKFSEKINIFLPLKKDKYNEDTEDTESKSNEIDETNNVFIIEEDDLNSSVTESIDIIINEDI